MSDEKQAVWAIVELMGHVKLAGRLSEEEKFGGKVGRLDIPSGCSAASDNWCPKCGRCTCPDPAEAKDHPGCKLHSPNSPHGEPEFATQFFTTNSLYRITIVTEDVARHVAKAHAPAPVSPWDFPKQLPAAQPACDEEDDPYDDRRGDDPLRDDRY